MVRPKQVRPKPTWSLDWPNYHTNYLTMCMQNYVMATMGVGVVGGGILSGLRQRVIGGIPGGVGKTDMWVVVATTMETRRKKKGNVGR